MDIQKTIREQKLESTANCESGQTKGDKNESQVGKLTSNILCYTKPTSEGDLTMKMEVEEVTGSNTKDNITGTKDGYNQIKTNSRAIKTVSGYLNTSSLIFDWEIPYIRRDQKQKLTSPTTKLESNSGINSSIWSLQLNCYEKPKDESESESWLSVYLWLRHIVKWPNIHSKEQYINYKIYLLTESGEVRCAKESGIRNLKETSAVGWKKFAPFSTVFSGSDFLSSGFTIRLELTALHSTTESHFTLGEMNDLESMKDEGKKLHSNSDNNMFQVLCDNATSCMQEERDKGKGNVSPRCAIICGTETRVMSAVLVAAHSSKLQKMILDQCKLKLDETNSVRIRSTHHTTPGVTALIPKIVLTEVSEPCFQLIMNFITTNDISLADEDIDFYEICKLMKTACFYHVWILATKCLQHMILSWLSVDTVSIIVLICELLPTELGFQLEDEITQVKQYFKKNWDLVKESPSFRSNILHDTNKKVFANLLLLN